MLVCENEQLRESASSEKQWISVYLLGGMATFLAIFASLMDIVISILLGGNLTEIPQTAVDRFVQFQGNRLLGLYYLDLLNVITSIIMIPVFFALFAAHRKDGKACSALSAVIAFIGTAVFISNNTALPMLTLSGKYALATTDAQRSLFAAAGEAMLARGAHGSPGVFIGFLLPTIASLIMSIVMLRGEIFNKITAWFGIAGSVLFVCYFVLMAFIPDSGNMAMAIATPGGILTIVWMTLFAVKLMKLRKQEQKEV